VHFKGFAAARLLGRQDSDLRAGSRLVRTAVTAAQIQTASAAAAALAGRCAPATAAGFRAEVEVDAAQLAQAAAIVPGVRRLADRVIDYHRASAYELIRTFKVVCTMISAAVEKDDG
jgi:D-amino peptidase